VGLSDVFALQISSAINLARSFGTPRGQGVSLKAASLSSRHYLGAMVRENPKFAPSLAAEISSFLGRQVITGQ
jgi:hypothetical protein